MNIRCLALFVSAKKCESGAIVKPMQHRRTVRLHQWINMAGTALLLLFVAREVRGQSTLDGLDPNANGLVPVVVAPTPPATVAATPTITADSPCTYTIYSQNFDGVPAPMLPGGWVTSFTAGPGNCTPAGSCAFGTNWATSTINPYSGPNCVFQEGNHEGSRKHFIDLANALRLNAPNGTSWGGES
jgi:hypothetical protein